MQFCSYAVMEYLQCSIFDVPCSVLFAVKNNIEQGTSNAELRKL
jgi:hypothetical protein